MLEVKSIMVLSFGIRKVSDSVIKVAQKAGYLYILCAVRKRKGIRDKFKKIIDYIYQVYEYISIFLT